MRLGRRPLLAMFGSGAMAPATLAKPAPRRWPHWQAIVYQHQSDRQLEALKRMGVTNGKVFASRDDAAGNPVQPGAARFARLGMRFYVENIATDFYSAYHRWRPDQPVDAAFLAVRALHRRAPDDPAAFIREPGLSDPAWLRRIAARLKRTVRGYARYRPLYYSLADEPGIADLAANWDFDISADSLAAMRLWLRGEYGSLAALNRQWGTDFAGWDDVAPRLTDAAVRQKGENFSAWADFKRWMDVAFARAVRMGRDAVHAADPHALAAIEGAQIPGWGGYDYARLAPAVDVMEIYDGDENIEIARSLNPALVMLMTFSSGDARQRHGLWRSVLRGMRGAILWDESDRLVNGDGSPGPWGRQVAPIFIELRGVLGRLLMESERVSDPVLTLYSPASLRTQWLLDRRAGGGPWENRGAEAETEGDDAVRAAMRRFSRMVSRNWLQGNYTAPGLVEQGALRGGHVRLLLLPHILALSPKAAAEIRRFVAGGGVVVADVAPGRFDEHSRRLPHPL
ncbi:MAG TPA: beta-galactosidase, partial [Acetobacteraceae bacterium]|nr:beta-galactosidase [Acetobacteraceae bacterium]